HSVQQDAARGQVAGLPEGLWVGDSDHPSEREANAAADRALAPQQAASLEKHGAVSVRADGQQVLRRENGGEGGDKGSETQAPPRMEEGARGEAAGEGPAESQAAPSCDPQGLARADYLKEPGTSTGDFGLTQLNG